MGGIGNMEQLGAGSKYRDKLCTMLEGIQMFDDFTRQEVEVLANYMQAYEAAAGTQVFREGNREGYMCFVVTGKLDIIKDTGGSGPAKITVVRSGKTIGEMSVIDGLPHSATAMVSEQATLVMMTKNNFERVCVDHPAIALKMLIKIAKLMSLRLRQTSGVLVNYLHS